MLPLGRRRKNRGSCGLWRTALQSRLFCSWETEAFNEPLFNWGVRHSRYLKLWFRLGVGIGFLLEVVIVFMMLLRVFSLLKNLGNEQISRVSTQQSGQALTLVIPGINVPWSDFPYMLLATTFAVGIHELGHAMAAASAGSTFLYGSEGVPIEHVAIFFACLIPGALIALHQESLQLLSPARALRIYCAGVWHNVMCCAGCYLLLVLLPVILSPLYVQSTYPLVSKIDAMSPLVGHLSVGDSIVTVAGLQLRKPDNWFEILQGRSEQEQAYFNQSSNDYLSGHQDNLIKIDSRVGGSSKLPHHVALHGFCACSEDFTKHESRLLSVMCPDDALLFYERPCTGAIPSGINSLQSIHCLKATDVVKCPACSMEQKSEATSHLCSCLGNTSCLFPLLNDGEVFVDIVVQQSSLNCSTELTDPGCEHRLVFVGDLKDLFYSLQLTNYWPRQVGFLGLLPVSSLLVFPKLLERLLMYTFSLSAAMALLNSAPVYYLDGELIFQAWLGCSKSWIHPKKHKKVMQVLLTVGTTLTAFFLVSEFIGTLF